jgi:hypothetical protein
MPVYLPSEKTVAVAVSQGPPPTPTPTPTPPPAPTPPTPTWSTWMLIIAAGVFFGGLLAYSSSKSGKK